MCDPATISACEPALRALSAPPRPAPALPCPALPCPCPAASAPLSFLGFLLFPLVPTFPARPQLRAEPRSLAVSCILLASPCVFSRLCAPSCGSSCLSRSACDGRRHVRISGNSDVTCERVPVLRGGQSVSWRCRRQCATLGGALGRPNHELRGRSVCEPLPCFCFIFWRSFPLFLAAHDLGVAFCSRLPKQGRWVASWRELCCVYCFQLRYSSVLVRVARGASSSCVAISFPMLGYP